MNLKSGMFVVTNSKQEKKTLFAFTNGEQRGTIS